MCVILNCCCLPAEDNWFGFVGVQLEVMFTTLTFVWVIWFDCALLARAM